MGMTITEKIMARSSGRDIVTPGELVWTDIHSVMTMDFLGRQCFDKFRSLGKTEVFDKNKVICVSDHLVPPPTQRFANMLNEWREVVKQHDITNFYDLGRQGIAHQIMVEKGHVLPGTISIGTDSHANTYGAVGAMGNAIGVTDAAVAMATGKAWFRIPKSVKFNITGKWQPWVMAKDLSLHIMGMMHWNGHLLYKSLEFTGPAIESMSMAGRMTLCNMTVDLGAKNGIVAPDVITERYLRRRTTDKWDFVKSDEDAVYDMVYDIDISDLAPTIAMPGKLDNTVTVDKLLGTKFNKAFVGTCTNGRLEDIATMAEIMKDKQVHRDVNMILVPASTDVYLEALQEGHLETLIKAGVAIDTPSCASCAGLHTGVAGDGDIVLSAGNRNMTGRMGSRNAQVYLTSPSVVAASAITGEITDPRTFDI
ncbi:3-isopropylmalate dehydratase large subunit [Maribacter algarum]|uniref:3-isopropylmalate dehydratase large subunit n=1 Tax=Maribacter algarum (ex Zhang et al. 2020) TaxID=2578118 RepID=A0A5S3PUF2_9FLAO|nr:3-isopropylmalate dehydratase large subunit [Maribacter algarum]TMM58631.1 3-isopropylmalate dehydratase large subunit [Maribacter algarum]